MLESKSSKDGTRTRTTTEVIPLATDKKVMSI